MVQYLILLESQVLPKFLLGHMRILGYIFWRMHLALEPIQMVQFLL